MISFSLYLLHYPILKAIYRSGLVINLPDHAFLSGLATTGLVLLPLSVAAATLTFYVIEKPPLALRRRYVQPVTRDQRLATLYGMHMESDRPTTTP
jgi:peptidoglycan/LPS O-acetylase OafA/YrhL